MLVKSWLGPWLKSIFSHFSRPWLGSSRGCRSPEMWLKISGGSGFFDSADSAKVLKMNSVSPKSDSGDTEFIFNTFAASAEPKNPEPPEIFSQKIPNLPKFSTTILANVS